MTSWARRETHISLPKGSVLSVQVWLAFWLFLASGQCTSLVVLRDDQLGVVLIGADSLVQPPHEPPRKECKIHQVTAPRFVAFAGMVQEDNPSSLDVAKRLGAVPIQLAIRQFYELASTYAQRKVYGIQHDKELSRKYERQLKGTVPWISALFAERDGRTALFEAVGIYVGAETSITVLPKEAIDTAKPKWLDTDSFAGVVVDRGNLQIRFQ